MPRSDPFHHHHPVLTGLHLGNGTRGFHVTNTCTKATLVVKERQMHLLFSEYMATYGKGWEGFHATASVVHIFVFRGWKRRVKKLHIPNKTFFIV